jgi:hypothetical protein
MQAATQRLSPEEGLDLAQQAQARFTGLSTGTGGWSLFKLVVPVTGEVLVAVEGRRHEGGARTITVFTRDDLPAIEGLHRGLGRQVKTFLDTMDARSNRN